MSSIHNFVSVDYLFRGKENRINCYVDPINTLKLEIEEKHTNLEWSASFSIEYIEELTKKTGNFKSFDVFVAMLQTVLTQNCESLSLDLMSYSDLEEMRKLKMGSIGLGKTPTVINSDANRQNKRYLILTYTTDFDKIHYPLPLTFQGVPDVKNLKETIMVLRRQLYSVAKGGTDYEKFEIVELNKKLIQLKSENDHLNSTIQKYKNHFQNSELNEDLKKELKAVKSIVHSLEEELAEEKSKHQRILMRKNRENKTLIDEVSELKASKRNLNFRVHSLTNELAMYKRQRNKNGFTSPRPPVCPSPKSSFDLLVASSKVLSKSTRNNRTRSPQMFSDPETSRNAHKSRSKIPYSLTDRTATNPRRCLSADRYQTSPSASKFDPTAYIELQKMKRKEIQERRKRELRSRLNSNNYSDRSRDSSPASYRNIHGITNRSNLISSSNASSMSNLDDKITINKSKSNSLSNKYDLEHLTEKKRLPTALNNDSDYEASENDSAYRYSHRLTNRKSFNGFKSSDNSIIEDDNFKNSKNKKLRRHLLDSEEEDTEIRSTRIGMSNITNEKKSRKSRLQQSNINNNNNLTNYHSSYNDPSEDINDIDRRLNALQSFFQKYLHDE